MSEHIELIDALGTLLDEQRRTTEAVIRLAEVIAAGNAKAPAAAKPSKPAAKQTPTTEPTPEPAAAMSVEDLMGMMVAYSKHPEGGKDAAKALLKKYGAAKVSEVKESDRTAIGAEIAAVLS